jgi:hypothetical protein
LIDGGEFVSRTRNFSQPGKEGNLQAIAHTNRKGVTYYLHEGRTKTGKVRYFFARSIRDGALAELPDGHEIAESINGIVSVRRRREGDARIPADDLVLVQAELRRHAHLRHHVALIERDTIVIHQPDVDLAGLRETAEALTLLPGRVKAFMQDRIRHAHFSPVLRFVRDGATYVVHRMTYRGHGGWSYPVAAGPLDQLVRELVSKVGTDEFFDLI